MRVKFYLKGFLGVCLSLALFALVNSSLLGFKKDKKSLKTQFKIAQLKQAKKHLKKPLKKKSKPKTLKPDMRSLISGLSFGIPALEMDFGSSSDFLNSGSYMDGSKVDKKPKVVYRPDLSFPEEALDKNISGYVVIGVFIDQEGRIQKTDVIESSPRGVFDKVALENLKAWKFKPAEYKGAKVATWQEQKIVFDLGAS